MKNSWLIWIFIVAVIITVFVAFNYENGKQGVPLAEIFPEESLPVDVAYEFTDQNTSVATPTAIGSNTQATTQKPTTVSAKAQEPQAQQQVAAVTKTQAPTTEAQTASAPTATTANNSKSSAYTIQVASYKQKGMADDFSNKLKAKNYESYVGSRTMDQGTFYRVYVGKFDSKQEAEAKLAEVQKEYKGSFIISPKN